MTWILASDWSHKLQTNLNFQSIQPHLYPSFHKWQSSFNITFIRRRSLFHLLPNFQPNMLSTVHNPSLRVFVWHGGGMLQMLQRQNSSNIPSMIGPELRGLWWEYIWNNWANIAWFNSARDFWQNAIDTVHCSAMQCLMHLVWKRLVIYWRWSTKRVESLSNLYRQLETEKNFAE